MNASNSISQTERLNLEATPTDPKEARWHGVLVGELDEVERAGEAPSLASVWKCPERGCQIQVVIAPVGSLYQPFNCMDGTPMVAGKSH